MLKVAILFCAVAFAAGQNGRVIGGSKTRIKNFPYQVSLRDEQDVHICGGVILNENTVITTAHCTEDEEFYSVRVGSTNHKKGDKYEIVEIYQHPKYNSATLDFDISVLKLGTNLVFRRTVQPIRMIRSYKEVVPGTLAVTSGWGVIYEISNRIPNTLRKVYIELISDAECYKANGRNSITKNMLCAKSIGQDSCTGDSGGPFVQNDKLIGLVSWSYGCAHPRYAGVFTKISALRPWIEQYL